MRQTTLQSGTSATPAPQAVVYAQLEDFARQAIQTLLQRVLEEEVESLLCRSKSERRDPGQPRGYRNGYGKERGLATSMGTLTLRRPRVRDTEEPLVSRVLPLFKRRTQEVGALLPTLYLHGLSCGDFELAMRGLLGESAPLSASSIGRLKQVWTAEYQTWKRQPIPHDVVYLFVDGIYVKAGLEKEKAALLVAIGVRADGSKQVLAVECGQRESEAGWSSILRDLKTRGMNCPKLVIGDGHVGIWAGLSNVFPQAGEQRCWNHRMRNVLDRVGKKQQSTAKELLSKVMYAPTLAQAQEARRIFSEWARSQQYEPAATLLEEDWERMVAYYAFPKEHWVHLRTSNIVESPFASVRLRTTASKRYKKVEGATALIWKLLMVAELTFRKITASELLVKVYAGIRCEDGVFPKSAQASEPPVRAA